MLSVQVLFPGVRLQCYQSSRFKQGRISLQFVRAMCLEEAAMNALLPAVLLRGTQNYPDIPSINRHLDDLYGASVGDLVRRIGDYQTTGFYAAFTEDRFALPGDKILEPITEFLQELMVRPIVCREAFASELVESEKKNLLADFMSQKNDKQTYAANQLMAALCAQDSFGIPRLGTKETIQAITPQGLYRHYQRVLQESPVEIFYVGSQPPEKVAALIKPLFSYRQEAWKPLAGQSPLRRGRDNHVTESMEISQSRLNLGFVTPITIGHEGFCAMQVLNAMYGSGMTSKLFMTVREKMSLCYSIGSAYYATKGILTVAAGIDAQQESVARQEILQQLELCRAGSFTLQELESGKQSLITGLKAVADSPGGIESFYAIAALSGLGMTAEEYSRQVEKVQPEQVIAAAKSLELCSSYFLEGL